MARRIADEGGFEQVELREGRIEQLPVDDASCDCVISNGVFNLASDKERFTEAARVLKPGGRLAIADIVSEKQMKESIVCDADVWHRASAVRRSRTPIERRSRGRASDRGDPGQPHEFISDRARDTSAKYGVKSVSLLAVKPQ